LTPFQTPRPMSASSGSETHPDESKSLFPPREKRKRSRVTPDQLVRLENFFAIDRSPTASRRREISLLLGMQERQTQIWFQNRYVLPHNFALQHAKLTSLPQGAQKQSNWNPNNLGRVLASLPHSLPLQTLLKLIFRRLCTKMLVRSPSLTRLGVSHFHL
jgi:hypothetical protein